MTIFRWNSLQFHCHSLANIQIQKIFKVLQVLSLAQKYARIDYRQNLATSILIKQLLLFSSCPSPNAEGQILEHNSSSAISRAKVLQSGWIWVHSFLLNSDLHIRNPNSYSKIHSFARIGCSLNNYDKTIRRSYIKN